MTLILGGIKTGKSSFAEKLARERENKGPVIYLATARSGDEEMADRIRRHQASRPPAWMTCEEPVNPASVFKTMIEARTIVLDCITNWLSNVILPLGEEPDRNRVFEIGRSEVSILLHAIRGWEKRGGECLVVSNQVELGLVSPWPLGRVFQDLSGLTHQRLAESAERVYLMNAGLALCLKGDIKEHATQ